MTVSERAEAIFTTGALQAPEFASLVGNIATAIKGPGRGHGRAGVVCPPAGIHGNS